LVVAALELFAEQGLDGPSLDAICERAGYTRGAFYVHFADRDELLVAVMEKVGEAFLAGLFEDGASTVASATERFVAAVASGAYPLMPAVAPSGGRAGAPLQVRPHQLIEACARSPVVRERYTALVEASIAHLASLATKDQSRKAMRAELDPRAVGTLLLALVLGAQTMAELGVELDPATLARTALSMLS
jgi:AcrR family transcriptional regulator